MSDTIDQNIGNIVLRLKAWPTFIISEIFKKSEQRALNNRSVKTFTKNNLPPSRLDSPQFQLHSHSKNQEIIYKYY